MARTRASWARTSRQLSSQCCVVVGQGRTGQQHRDVPLEAVLVRRAAHRCRQAAQGAERDRPTAHRALLLVGGEGGPPQPDQVRRSARRWRARPDAGGPSRSGQQRQQRCEVALASGDRGAAGGPSGQHGPGGSGDQAGGEPGVRGDAVEHLEVPTVHGSQLGLLGGAHVVCAQPPERPHELAVLEQPAGLAPVLGHQRVVLAAQCVDRRTGLGDHLRVDTQLRGPTGAAARPASAPARWPCAARRGTPGPPGLARPRPAARHRRSGRRRPAPRRPPAVCTAQPRRRPPPARPAGRAAPRPRSSRRPGARRRPRRAS